MSPTDDPYGRPTLPWDAPAYGVTLLQGAGPARAPAVVAKALMSLKWHSPPAQSPEAAVPGRGCGGDEADDPWGFRGPIFGR